MNNPLQGTVNLPGSKSESNRALMISAYGGFPLEVDNLSEAHDTVLLKAILEHIRASSNKEFTVVDCEDAGTVARFMMTYLACRPGTWLLTGSERLRQRPMAPLIEALCQLNADIACTDVQGHLPVRICGKQLEGGRVILDATQSSQFASSLLMASPTWEHGLQLSLVGKPVSMPYLEMTLEMLEYFGVQIHRNGDVITVASQQYHPRSFTVSADWSAASFWYELVALGNGGKLLLKGLKSNSLQGDVVAKDLFASLGVGTEFVEQGAWVFKEVNLPSKHVTPLVFDFNHTPDLFPSIFSTCVALNIDTVFKGISTLSNKESDRINSMITELSKVYTFINIIHDDEIIIGKSSLKINLNDIKSVIFNTYHDHRIAMSLAALSISHGKMSFDNLSVVNKSYPTFWEELNKLI
jgi:3-phosphoshikimate 1-carboxyvinyltransferase